MSRPSIENIKSLGDFATNLNWNIAIAQWPTDMQNQIAFDDFNFRCRQVLPPSYTSQPISITVRGQTVHQPGTYTPTGTMEFQLLETTDNKVNKMLKSWRELCWSSIYGQQNTKKNVQATLYLERLDRQDNVIWQYFVYGCFLVEFDPTGGMLTDGMVQEVLAPTVRLSYDYFIDQAVDGANTDPSDAYGSTGGAPTGTAASFNFNNLS